MLIETFVGDIVFIARTLWTGRKHARMSSALDKRASQETLRLWKTKRGKEKRVCNVCAEAKSYVLAAMQKVITDDRPLCERCDLSAQTSWVLSCGQDFLADSRMS